jgi:hypothetical protein
VFTACDDAAYGYAQGMVNLRRIAQGQSLRPTASEQDFRPMKGLSNPRKNPEDWLSATQTVTRAESAGRHRVDRRDLVRQAAAGHLRTWAPSYQVGKTPWVDVEPPPFFWAALGQGAEQIWAVGKFTIPVRKSLTVSAYAVVFHRGDLQELFPKIFAVVPPPPKPASPLSPAPLPTATPKAKGGRKMSASWPDWVAELVAYIHESGVPEGEGTAGVDVVLKAVADQLASRGLEGPARSTVQETMRAVLLRLRAPETH